jgi:hypothetical protein
MTLLMYSKYFLLCENFSMSRVLFTDCMAVRVVKRLLQYDGAASNFISSIQQFTFTPVSEGA